MADLTREEAVEIVERRATEHGWLRRPELDTEAYDAWERPNGTMQAVQKGLAPRLVTLAADPSTRAEETGDGG